MYFLRDYRVCLTHFNVFAVRFTAFSYEFSIAPLQLENILRNTIGVDKFIEKDYLNN